MVSLLILSAFRARSRLDTYHTQALPEDEDLPITRYLVKWKQFSFLHVSWETKRDLESIDQKACQRAIMSLQGRERKGQVPEIGKPPCAKRAFDPQMVEVVRGGVPLSESVAVPAVPLM